MRGGTLVIAGQREPACLNVLLAACGLVGVSNPVLEGAFELRPDYTYRPQLVSHVTVSKNPFTLTYHVRPAARWSDGTSVTAADFVFTFQIAPGLPEEVLRKIRSVRAVDAKTVRVAFRRGELFADWRALLFTVILPRHALVGAELETIWQTGIDNPKTGIPIGSGPFLVESWERGRQLTVVRNPRYWGQHDAYLDRIVVRFLQTSELADAMRRGEVDVGTAGAEELLRRPVAGVEVVSEPSSTWEHLDVRIGGRGHPALEARLVRQALAYGIDREAIVRAVDARFARESGAVRRLLDSVVFPTRSPFYRPNWKGYRYRPGLARRLLERAGCRRGADEVYVCAGERLSLRLLTTAGSPQRQLELELIQAQLRRVGIEARPTYVPPATLFGRTLPTRDFDIVLYAWVGGGQLLSPYHTFRCDGKDNFTGYCSRPLTLDLLRTTVLVDDAERAALQNRIDRKLAIDVPAIPLFELPTLLARRTTVRNVAPNPGGDIAWNAEDWWLAR